MSQKLLKCQILGCGTIRERGSEAGSGCLAHLRVLEIMDKDPSQSSALAGRIRPVPLENTK